MTWHRISHWFWLSDDGYIWPAPGNYPWAKFDCVLASVLASIGHGWVEPYVRPRCDS